MDLMVDFARLAVLTYLGLPLLTVQAQSFKPCDLVKVKYGFVCQCNATYCDTIQEYTDIGANQAALYTSTEDGQRMHLSVINILTSEKTASNRESGPLRGSDDDKASKVIDIQIDTSKRLQTIRGFGGALTDSAIKNINALKPELQSHVLQSYYGSQGLGYTIARVPISSTDFSDNVYSYHDAEDLELKNFSIAMDEVHKIPMIKRVLNMSARNMTLFASLWAPPVWMCRRGSTVNCKLKGDTQGPYYRAVAEYYSKFLSEYKEHGLHFWAITSQNEPYRNPLQLGQGWQSLRFNEHELRDFVKYHLGPVVKTAHPETKIILHDDQRDLLPKWATTTLSDPEANKFVDGVGVHWYSTVDFRFGPYFKNLDQTHQAHPDKFIMATEACEGFHGFFDSHGPKLGSWYRAENYARDIIGTLRNWGIGWMDWNIVLDLQGGPTWARNFVDSPILADTNSGNVIYKQAMYYVMGHFSKLILPGSVRVEDKVTFRKRWWEFNYNVETVSFCGPSDELLVVVLNRDKAEYDVKLNISSGKHAEFHISGRSIHTLRYEGGCRVKEEGDLLKDLGLYSDVSLS